jgi:DNA-binding FadR family transcriptional regulator
MFRPIRTRKIFEEAIAQIAEAIQTGQLGVGEKLPSERTLAGALAISRPTLREAVRILVDAGVLEVKPGPSGGMFVKSDVIRPSLYEEVPNIALSEVGQTLEARRVLEPRVAQLAALNATDEDFELMRRSIEDQERVSDNRDRALVYDRRFHLILARASRNALLVQLMRTIFRQLELAQDIAMRAPHEPAWATAIHRRTLQAIMSGDYDEIELAMDEHLSFLESIWEEATGRARLRQTPAFLLPHPRRATPDRASLQQV